jgi:hypothetical protein
MLLSSQTRRRIHPVRHPAQQSRLSRRARSDDWSIRLADAEIAVATDTLRRCVARLVLDDLATPVPIAISAGTRDVTIASSDTSTR